MWSSLAVYFTVWVFGMTFAFTDSVILVIALPCVYVGMHVFEIRKLGRCYLDADPTAAPVTFSLGIAAFFSSGGSIGGLWRFGAFMATTLMVGHAAALLYSAVVDSLLKFLFRKRIRAERKSGGTCWRE